VHLASDAPANRELTMGHQRCRYALLATLAILLASTGARAQEVEQGQAPPPPAPAAKPAGAAATRPTTRPASTDTQEQRLARLEAQMRDLVQSVNDLRKMSQPPSTAYPVARASSPTTAPAPASPLTLDAKWQQALTWRSIGPAGMGGRIVDFAVNESDPSMFWVATASGGLLKTTNNGITFAHQFDHESTVSVGCVAVAPSDPNVLWVGTGENNPRNSVSWGDGVYKSTDGGKTWKNMGLKRSFQIGRIAIHRTNPNIVYVGTLGRLYGPSEERGLFKTTDGGQSWQRVLFVDDKTGVIDVQMHPTDSDTLMVATWERLRDGYDSHPGGQMPDGYDSYDPIKKWGAGSGLYKTTDGGNSWRKITKGLPTNKLGRIGIEYYRKSPDTVFAIVDCEKIGMGAPPRSGASVYMDISAEDGEGGVRISGVRENGPSAKAGLLVDDLIQSVNDKPVKTREQLTEEFREHKVGDKLKLKVLRGPNQLEITITLERRPADASAAAAYVGISGEDAEEGVKVLAVGGEGPAEKAGVKPDDIIQAIGNKSITSNEQLLEEIRSRNPGDKVKLKLTRDGQPQEIELTLAERPAGAGGGRQGGGGGGGGGGRRGGPQAAGAYAGINGEEAEGGVRLTTVVESGPAGKASLKPGDVITSVDGKAVDRYEEFVEVIRAHKAGDKLALAVRSGGQPARPVTLTLGDRTQAAAAPATRPSAGALGGQVENVQDEQGPNSFEYGGIYKSTDGGETWRRINSLNPRPMYFSNIKCDPKDDRYLYVCGVSLYKSADGGKTFRPDAGRGVHADQHAFWIDPRDGRHMLVGCDGGFYATYDRAANWDHLNTVAIAQFYHVAICPHQPYHVAGGLQDNGSWCGPTVTLNGSGPINEDWISVGGGDGFVCRVDWNDPDVIYSESQNGAIQRRNIRTGERAAIRPQRSEGAPPYRFNWNSPFILSSHNTRIFYSAGNFVFRSLDRGNNLKPISPEITLTKQGSATALAESPKDPNVLYVGTDDGALWVTRDSGKTWVNITKNTGFPEPRWVATIEPSRFVEGRAYVAFDGHRADDDRPLVYVTEDYGQTFKPINANLPAGSTRCLREDLFNPRLLYLGTEFGAWCSLDRGASWNRLGANLPTVAVHEFAIHPTAGEIVAATHGRSLWVLDVSALRQIKPEHLASDPVLYEPNTTMRWRSEPARSRTNRRFVGQNPTLGAQVYYALPQPAEKVTLKIVDIAGTTLRELPAKRDAGLNRVTWDLRPVSRQANATSRPTTRPTAGTTRATRTTTRPNTAASRSTTQPSLPGVGPQQRFAGSPPVPPGAYRIVLTVDGREFAQTLHVEADPIVAESTMAEESSDADEEEEEEEEREREERMESIRPAYEID
jgi:S1-C subfamily serine protease/photosystem II stability/assembly factor-like uncharacterized protein